MITYSPSRMCGISGWSWELRINGHVTRSGWSAGKRKDAVQDAKEAERKINQGVRQ